MLSNSAREAHGWKEIKMQLMVVAMMKSGSEKVVENCWRRHDVQATGEGGAPQCARAFLPPCSGCPGGLAALKVGD
jgi:hypothetical protein